MARKANPTRIQKSGSGHSYYLDGEWCPGVTTVLSNGIPKPGLIGWAANTVSDFVVNRLATARNGDGETRIVADELIADLRTWNGERSRPTRWSDSDVLPRSAVAEVLANVRYRDLDEASKRGTEVHFLAERLSRGEVVEVPSELKGHVDAYVQFLEEWQPRNAILERVVVNRRWRYMGKFDLVADFDGVWSSGPWEGRPIGRGLLDVKTSRSGIFAEVALQLQAYRFAETMLEGDGEVPIPDVDFVAAIHVRSDGYDVIPFDVSGDKATDAAFRTFLYAKQVGDWLDWKSGPAATIKLDAARPPRSTT